MLTLVLILLALPFTAGAFIAFGGIHREQLVSRVAMTTITAYALMVAILVGTWIANGQHHLQVNGFMLYQIGEYDFPVTFFLDSMGAMFLTLVAFLGTIVFSYSRYYLHRDPGYQRFFSCLMFLVFGLSLLILSGSLDILIAGWEFVGICSFLLIGFYQGRTQPVRNAFKVLCIYRFCDIGLLLGAWLSHVVWHDADSFAGLSSIHTHAQLASTEPWILFGFTCLILLAAAGKSAQFPFTFWLSRAMEGPTPSSAIFYGALSVHAGAFLLYRTHVIWSSFAYGPWMVGALGAMTAVIAAGIGRVQSNIKGQIAYASAAQVGLIFVELALGWKDVAMIHIFGNACLRCYQLLVSPSVVAYLLREQSTNAATSQISDWSIEKFVPKKLATSVYTLCLNDGYLEALVNRTIWAPMVAMGRVIQRADRWFFWVVAPIVALLIIIAHAEFAPHIEAMVICSAAITMLGFTFAALAETRSATRAWTSVVLSNAMAAAAVWSLEPHAVVEILVFLTGVVFFWIIGLQALFFLGADRQQLRLDRYHGMSLTTPGASVMLFVSFLGVAGFPISPTFIGQDLLLDHAVGNYLWLAVVMALSFSVNGIALARVYTKICLGGSPNPSR